MKAEKTYKDLPTECLLRVLSFLALPDIAILLRTSKLWNAIITSSEQILYHQFANNLDSICVPLDSPSTALDGWLSQEANKVRSWKEYCKIYH
jgi:hypothetical protein